MSILYVTEQGAEVGLKGARIEVRKGPVLLQALRLPDLEQVLLCGNVQLTTQALRALLRHGVDAAFLTQGGTFLGRVSGPTGKNVELRRAQYRRLQEPGVDLAFARRFIAGKLINQRAVLMRHQRERPDDVLARSLVGIRLSLESLPAATSLDEVRGLEGRAAADYFRAFPSILVAPGVTFTVRARRPPPDPVNILLSFGYTLLGNIVQGYLELAGLDPHLGCLHSAAYGRPSLALDLIEEMRPVIVDVAVVRAFNTRATVPRDFVPTGEPEAPAEDEWEREELERTTDPGGSRPARRIVLTAEGSRKWITSFERRLAEEAFYPSQARRLSYRQILREQVYLFARDLKGEDEYRSFEHRA